MFYLCPAHRRELAGLSPHETQELWLRWISHAGMYYDLADWREAIPYLGCAYDLMESAVMDGRVELEEGLVPLTLSAIYLQNACEQCREQTRAAWAQERLRRCLSRLQPPDRLTAIMEECRQALEHRSWQGRFFRRYLNFPFQAAPEMKVH